MEKRAHKRIVVDLEVAASVGIQSTRVTICDLSMDGCLIEACGSSLPPEASPISLYIPEVNVTRGNLVWTKGRLGGVKFAERMDEAWVRHLDFKPRTAMPTFRDQFGRTLFLPGQPFDLAH